MLTLMLPNRWSLLPYST